MQTALRRKTETGNEKDPSATLGMTKRGKTSSHFVSFRCEPTSAPSGHLLPEEGGRMPASLHRHFERKREIFFVPFSHDPFAKPFRGSTASALPRYGVSRSLLSNTLRLTANKKDPSAALGMTKRGNVSSLFSFRYGSQPPPLRGTSFQRKEGECRRNRAAIPRASPSGRPFAGEGGRMPFFASSFRAKARNLFRPLFP